jgi:hypothetical protein
MRLRLLPLALLPLALAACGGSAESTTTAAKPEAAAPETNAKAPKELTLHVTSVVSGTKATDTPPKGASDGDHVDFSDRLLNTRPQFGKDANAEVGSDSGTMTFTGAHTARLEGEAVLPDGKITFGGNVTVVPYDSIRVPVTGGTGRYQNASGTLLVGAGDQRAQNVYKLVFDAVAGPVA